MAFDEDVGVGGVAAIISAEQRQKERTETTDQTKENHSQEEHGSVEDLLPSEATQMDMEE